MRAITFTLTFLNYNLDYVLSHKLKWKDILNDLEQGGRLKQIRASVLAKALGLISTTHLAAHNHL